MYKEREREREMERQRQTQTERELEVVGSIPELANLTNTNGLSDETLNQGPV